MTTYCVQLLRPRYEDVNGRRSFLGWPLPAGDNWLQASSDGKAIATTYESERALQFTSVDDAHADPEVQRASAYYELEVRRTLEEE